jgi:hypothetical protein
MTDKTPVYERVMQYTVILLFAVGLLAMAYGLIWSKDSSRQEIVFKVESSNVTLDNSTIAFANLYYECLKFCYQESSSSYCPSNCQKILDTRC